MIRFLNFQLANKAEIRSLISFNNTDRRVATNQLASEYIPMEMRIESQGPDETVQSLPKENNIS